MASFDYTISSTYVNLGTELGFVDGDPGNGTLSIAGDGNTFSVGDDLTNTGDIGPTVSEFYGSYTYGSTVVVLTTNGSVFFGWAYATNPGPMTLPQTIPVDEISTGTFTACFLSGVAVATPDGAVGVEQLAPGDLVLTADGRAVPVKWVGRQTVFTALGPPDCRWPVILQSDSLAPGLPNRALRLTSDHAIKFDRLLVQVGALVNGVSIRRMTASELGQHYVVYHVETENHEMILAEGVPCETFVDNVSRRRFDNFAEYVARHGDSGSTVPEIDAPRVKSARQLPREILERLGIMVATMAA